MKTRLTKDNAKVGMEIEWIRDLISKTGTIAATSISTFKSQLVFDVIWKKPNLRSNGYVLDGKAYAKDEGWFIVSETISSVVKEKSCNICSRNNDVGVTVCWCCGNNPG